MAGNSEEVLFRLGFATDQFDSGVRKLSGQMESVSEHIVEHMQRPRVAVRAFHTALHEVGNISPVVGTAIQLAFNPVVAVIGMAVFALKGLYDGMKERQAQFKEMMKDYAELSKLYAAPIDKGKDVREAQTAADKKAGEDRRAMAKEQQDLNDPIEKSIELLRRQEEQFAANHDTVGKLAAQKKLLAEIEAQRTEARTPVEAYESEDQLGARKHTTFMKEEAERRIKSMESEIEKFEKVKEKTKAAYDEQQKIDEDFKNKTGAFPNLNKLLSFGDTQREEKVNQYKQAEAQQEALRRSIEQTTKSVRNFDESMADGKAKHEEELARLKKLDAVHKDLSARVASTELSIQKAGEAGTKEITELDIEQKQKQDEFNLKRARLVREEKRAEVEPYLPTVQELAKLPGWGGMEPWRLQMQSMGPRIASPEAMKAGEEARELQAREVDLRQTVLTEGPQSTRAKEDLDRIKTLKKSLEDSGFIKTDHAEKLNERMSELVEMAKKDGLVVKPINGE